MKRRDFLKTASAAAAAVTLGQVPASAADDRIGTRSRAAARRELSEHRIVKMEARRVRDLVVAGVLTQLCVESTVRDAFDLGFRVFVPMDACASSDEDSHLAALRTLGSGFAYVLRARSLLESL